MQKTTKKLCISGIFIALGIILGQFSIPVGAAKVFPMQHFLNVLGAMLLGPGYGIVNAILISLMRNLLGVGSILAFPGSMIGAFLAAMAYQKTKNAYLTIFGEIIGTGVLGALLSCPIAFFFMGKSVGLAFFVLPFLMSTVTGSLIALVFYKMGVVDVLQGRLQVNPAEQR